MSTLATRIEYYIKELLSEEGKLRIKRNELAVLFDCAPSQVSYVLQTRFSLERGYIVESQRGGGGYVEITEIPQQAPRKFLAQLYKKLDLGISQRGAKDILHRLERENLISSREKILLQNIISREVLDLELPRRDLLRGKILKSVIESLYCNLLKEG